MFFLERVRRLFEQPKTLKESHQEVAEIKAQTTEALSLAVQESVERSSVAGRKFSKMGLEVETMAEDIADRIYRATGGRKRHAPV